MPRLLRPLLMSLALLAAPAHAAQYQVEVLVFRQAAQPLLTAPAPEDWNSKTLVINPQIERTPLLDTEIGRMQESGRYQVLSRKSWLQDTGSTPTRVSFSDGQLQDGHGQVDVLVSLQEEGSLKLDFKAWVNHFDADGFLSASELVQQQRPLLPGVLTYIDHPTLGALIRVRQP